MYNVSCIMYHVWCTMYYVRQTIKYIFWHRVQHTRYSHLIPPTSINYSSYITLPNVSYLIFQLANQNSYFLIITKFYLYSCTDTSFHVYFLTRVPRFRKFFTQIWFADVIITTLAFYTILNFVYKCNKLQFRLSTLLKNNIQS